jgi:hypothetical protein
VRFPHRSVFLKPIEPSFTHPDDLKYTSAFAYSSLTLRPLIVLIHGGASSSRMYRATVSLLLVGVPLDGQAVLDLVQHEPDMARARLSSAA